MAGPGPTGWVAFVNRSNEPPQGISGWLALVAVGVVVTPFKFLIETVLGYLPLFTGGSWTILTDPSSAEYVRFLGPLVVFELVVSLTFVVCGFLLIGLFFRESAKAPALIIALLLSTPAFAIIFAWLGGLVFPKEPMFDLDSAGVLARQILVCLIWVPYMLESQRVKATFKRPHRAFEPQSGELKLMNPWED